MKPLRQFFQRATAIFRRPREERRLAAEIEHHLAEQTAENIRAGLPPEEARRRAVLKFGGIEAAREAWRDQRSLPFLETLAGDARLALRRLRNSPAFTLTTILTL